MGREADDDEPTPSFTMAILTAMDDIDPSVLPSLVVRDSTPQIANHWNVYEQRHRRSLACWTQKALPPSRTIAIEPNVSHTIQTTVIPFVDGPRSNDLLIISCKLETHQQPFSPASNRRREKFDEHWPLCTVEISLLST